ncbi:MaoC family dehydratase N-terminal domain-containing protein [Hydrogenophaga sp. SNF1]|uniref:Acyl-CoA dehydrogenase n=1 Tax=Hydrogenophaga borbori TaxID=2294117 RepID=A0A372EFZ4_9BURK|nr:MULTISPECIES: MaoC family dehydratase N-terminal domain-containing protein [Hydrogenophaga]RFP77315.1 acyl-CoA dehydrogenase [Hydrogenophaga borbori]WQB83375.1 MaoC family dehydratase N-terminal domain-containing protein [Hydrogenophaga sp. SNF1]
MSGVDLEHLRQWVGRSETREQHLDPFPAQALAGLLDRSDRPQEGDALPLPWHWLYFLDAPSREGTGVDGHPRRGGFLPPVPLPRRMWAAGELTLHEPLRLGRVARKTSTVRSVDLKQGKAGALVFVTVAHELEQDGQPRLSERQHIVYREAPTAPAPLPPGEAAPADADWRRDLVPDPVMLFRFSALTYNGHRIHYDRDYATREEFYPALVVHGPLLATLLLDLAARERPGAVPTHFGFRAQRPAFDTGALRLNGRLNAGADGAALWTSDPQGFVGMSATLRWR